MTYYNNPAQIQPELRAALKWARSWYFWTGRWRRASQVNRFLKSHELQGKLATHIFINTMAYAQPKGSLLDWFKENWDLILKIILMILAL